MVVKAASLVVLRNQNNHLITIYSHILLLLYERTYTTAFQNSGQVSNSMKHSISPMFSGYHQLDYDVVSHPLKPEKYCMHPLFHYQELPLMLLPLPLFSSCNCTLDLYLLPLYTTQSDVLQHAYRVRARAELYAGAFYCSMLPLQPCTLSTLYNLAEQ